MNHRITLICPLMYPNTEIPVLNLLILLPAGTQKPCLATWAWAAAMVAAALGSTKPQPNLPFWSALGYQTLVLEILSVEEWPLTHVMSLALILWTLHTGLHCMKLKQTEKKVHLETHAASAEQIPTPWPLISAQQAVEQSASLTQPPVINWLPSPDPTFFAPALLGVKAMAVTATARWGQHKPPKSALLTRELTSQNSNNEANHVED